MTADLSRLTSPSAPYFHVLHGASEAFDQLLSKISQLPGATVRTIEGQDATTVSELMHSFSEALEFPDYFTSNWDSLDECLTDLEWLPSRTIVLAIRDVSELLSEAEEEREVLAEILWVTAEAWGEASEPSLPISFHIVLHDQFNGLDDWMQELNNLGADFDHL